ncbi:hypothetical protein OH76DRAFT_1184590 [Lentinus brumalis]|uniref:Uncharacterized protein n=1 Tax=Lentinus brumalis TaxID=2498619 RepID=A0A371CTX9_9APHY|nr:hypothetical protein OH76DRAFT_1184590 [Polyporus brumalis]
MDGCMRHELLLCPRPIVSHIPRLPAAALHTARRSRYRLVSRAITAAYVVYVSLHLNALPRTQLNRTRRLQHGRRSAQCPHRTSAKQGTYLQHDDLQRWRAQRRPASSGSIARARARSGRVGDKHAGRHRPCVRHTYTTRRADVMRASKQMRCRPTLRLAWTSRIWATSVASPADWNTQQCHRRHSHRVYVLPVVEYCRIRIAAPSARKLERRSTVQARPPGRRNTEDICDMTAVCPTSNFGLCLRVVRRARMARGVTEAQARDASKSSVSVVPAGTPPVCRSVGRWRKGSILDAL